MKGIMRTSYLVFLLVSLSGFSFSVFVSADADTSKDVPCTVEQCQDHIDEAIKDCPSSRQRRAVSLGDDDDDDDDNGVTLQDQESINTESDEDDDDDDEGDEDGKQESDEKEDDDDDDKDDETEDVKEEEGEKQEADDDDDDDDDEDDDDEVGNKQEADDDDNDDEDEKDVENKLTEEADDDDDDNDDEKEGEGQDQVDDDDDDDDEEEAEKEKVEGDDEDDDDEDDDETDDTKDAEVGEQEEKAEADDDDDDDDEDDDEDDEQKAEVDDDQDDDDEKTDEKDDEDDNEENDDEKESSSSEEEKEAAEVGEEEEDDDDDEKGEGKEEDEDDDEEEEEKEGSPQIADDDEDEDDEETGEKEGSVEKQKDEVGDEDDDDDDDKESEGKEGDDDDDDEDDEIEGKEGGEEDDDKEDEVEGKESSPAEDEEEEEEEEEDNKMAEIEGEEEDDNDDEDDKEEDKQDEGEEVKEKEDDEEEDDKKEVTAGEDEDDEDESEEEDREASPDEEEEEDEEEETASEDEATVAGDEIQPDDSEESDDEAAERDTSPEPDVTAAENVTAGKVAGDTSAEERPRAHVPTTPSEQPKTQLEEEDEDEENEDEDEEELITEGPGPIKSRDHIISILGLDDESLQAEASKNKVTQSTLTELRKVYTQAIKPLESLYKFTDISQRQLGDAEIFSKPLLLFLGPWSSGKSAFINYLLGIEYSPSALRTGAEPGSNGFNVIQFGEQEQSVDGQELMADWAFSSLQKYGQAFLENIRGKRLKNPLLEKVTIVDTPGIIEHRKDRRYPFNDVCQWFIDRADLIFVVFDPTKLDLGIEMEAIFDQLKGRESQVRILVNKADTVKPQELMKVQATLLWNLSPFLVTSDPPTIYVGSFWSKPYFPGAPDTLFDAQEEALLYDIREAIDARVENKVALARRHAVRVRNHAKMVDCYLNTFNMQKSMFGDKKKLASSIVANPQDFNIYEGLSALTNVSRYDLPDPDIYREFFRFHPLFDFKPLKSTCSYFKGCPLDKLDAAIAYNLPDLVGKFKRFASSLTGSSPRG